MRVESAVSGAHALTPSLEQRRVRSGISIAVLRVTFKPVKNKH
jgi:hypothetical protein